MYSSGYYQNMINECESIISKISSVLGYFDDCINAINVAQNNGADLVLNNMPLGLETLTNVLGGLVDNKQKLDEIILECEEKKQEFISLKNQALARENSVNA